MPVITFESILIIYISVAALTICGLFIYIFSLLREFHKIRVDKDILFSHLKQAQNQIQHINTQKSNKTGSDWDKLIDKFNFGIILLNPNGVIININEYVRNLIGKTQLDILFNQFHQFCSVRLTDKSNFNDILNKTLPEKQFDFSDAIMTLGNTSMPVKGSLTAFEQNDQKHLLLVFFDQSENIKKVNFYQNQVSTLKQELSQLTGHNMITEVLFNNGSFYAILIDKNDQIYYLNPLASNLFSKSNQVIINVNYKNVFSLTDEQDNPIDKIITDARNGQKMVFNKWTFLRVQNNKIPITGEIIPLKNNVNPGSLALVFQDAAESYQKETEEKAFFSGAAHDLRSPLSTVRAALELLSTNFQKLPPETIKQILSGANDSILFLISLVNDLLNISRLELGRVVIRKEPIDLSGVINEIIEAEKVTASNKKLFLNYQAQSADLPKVLADKNKTSEILTNLISNAIKYTIQGGITISHRIEQTHVVTLIEDTGVGIDPQSQKLLFRKFQQVGGAKKLTTSKSIGLGLYISKRFAELMNGDLSLVKSLPNNGSVFSLKLPVAPNIKTAAL